MRSDPIISARDFGTVQVSRGPICSDLWTSNPIMFVASLRTVLRRSQHCKLVPSPLSQFCAPRFTFMSTSLAPNVKRPFDESSTSVRINDKEDGEEFVCDEEPHMLLPEQGFGYYPITLGQ